MTTTAAKSKSKARGRSAAPFSRLPSVDRILGWQAVGALAAAHGRTLTAAAVRAALDDIRAALVDEEDNAELVSADGIVGRVEAMLIDAAAPSLKRVFNLTGTVIHTNLGRAPLADAAVDAVAAAARNPSNLEFDLGSGRRGDRDAHLEAQICRLTGAEAATVVNNNAAAVLLVLNTLALRREVIVSRGELVEIGGAFRMPDVMARAGAKLREVGTTNRTHLKDFAGAIGPKTGLVMKVHTSNYEIRGFTAAVAEADLAGLAHEHEVSFVVDLGSGMLADLERWGLPHEQTAQETLAAGADLVTFSGDKLLGGPQAGVVAGRADLVAKLKRNPLKRALRCDKMTIAALSATLRLYDDPDRLADGLPVLRLLTRPVEAIEKMAAKLAPALAEALGGVATVETQPGMSQVGSGALPVDTLPSVALAIRPDAPRKRQGALIKRIAEAFRGLPVPVIGRVADGVLYFDLRCLEDADAFLEQLSRLDLSAVPRR